jgi:asparagine synthase (glutamine-hydrolysing)
MAAGRKSRATMTNEYNYAMCGIAGVFSYRPFSAIPDFHDELQRTRDCMASRGPDGSGLWLSADRRVGLAHRRLSIVELSEAGAQPMATPDGRYRISFNGEIYNYRALRQHLVERGCTLRTNSDTEVLLHLFAEYGADMLKRLRGMYAFAIWDETNRSLFLARDPFGIKPLYYADDGQTFRFASQVKALLAGGAVSDARDPAGHAGFFLWGSVPEPFTTYQAIRSLRAGCSLQVADGRAPVIRSFFDLREEIATAEQQRPSVSDPHGVIAAALSDTVAHHLVADVPVGLFLSSGIDSAALAAFAADRVGGQLRTVTLGFSEFAGRHEDETRLAREIAARCGTQHMAACVSREDFANSLASLLLDMDQPSIDGVNTWLVSRVAARAGLKVALSGVGGDELFGTYPSFRQIPRMRRWLRAAAVAPLIGKVARWASAPLMERVSSPKYAGMLEYGGTVGGAYLLRRGLYMPWEVPSLMGPEAAREGLEQLSTLDELARSVHGIQSVRLQITALEMQWYMRNQLLRDADWAGMAHSLEVRTPLVDIDLFRALLPVIVARVPVPKSQMVMSAPIALPPEVVRRAKTGFSVPMSQWHRSATGRRLRGLRHWARTVDAAGLRGHRVVALVTDAYGGRGGIAGFNRDMLSAICTSPAVQEVVVMPRIAPDPSGAPPRKVSLVKSALGGKLSYVWSLLRILRGPEPVDAILCGHINLVPLATLASRWSGAPVILVIHGVDAWTAPRSWLVRRLAPRAHLVVAVSSTTRERFLGWTDVKPPVSVLPNSIKLSDFGPGTKPDYLLERYGLRNRRILLTLGRLAPHERYKGFDEVIGILPTLRRQIPDIAYVIAGDGPDRPRLEALAAHYGVADIVTFTGYVPETEKADHFRLADCYLMPSRGEGFGRVYLEALACGIPVVGSRVDGGREALRDGELGELVDPGDADDILRATRVALARGRGGVPDGLSYFASEANDVRWGKVLEAVLN